MPKSNTSDEQLILRQARALELAQQANERAQQRDQLMLNLAMSSFQLIQTSVMSSNLVESPGRIGDYDISKLHADKHTPGVLRAAKFEDGSILQLTTAHGFEDRSHVIALLGTEKRDHLNRYSRTSLNVQQRALGSRSLSVNGINHFLMDPSNFMLVGDIRTLVEQQEHTDWPHHIDPERLAMSRAGRHDEQSLADGNVQSLTTPL